MLQLHANLAIESNLMHILEVQNERFRLSSDVRSPDESVQKLMCAVFSQADMKTQNPSDTADLISSYLRLFPSSYVQFRHEC